MLGQLPLMGQMPFGIGINRPFGQQSFQTNYSGMADMITGFGANFGSTFMGSGGNMMSGSGSYNYGYKKQGGSSGYGGYSGRRGYLYNFNILLRHFLSIFLY
jgi:hypothetical protein